MSPVCVDQSESPNHLSQTLAWTHSFQDWKAMWMKRTLTQTSSHSMSFNCAESSQILIYPCKLRRLWDTTRTMKPSSHRRTGSKMKNPLTNWGLQSTCFGPCWIWSKTFTSWMVKTASAITFCAAWLSSISGFCICVTAKEYRIHWSQAMARWFSSRASTWKYGKIHTQSWRTCRLV